MEKVLSKRYFLVFLGVVFSISFAGCASLLSYEATLKGARYRNYLLSRHPKEMVLALESRTTLDLKRQSGKALTAEEQAEFDRTDRMLVAYRDSHPAFKSDLLFAQDVGVGKISVGMRTDQVRVIWGPPVRVNRDTYGTSVHEQWVYAIPGKYAYFKNGRLTSYSQSESRY